MVAPGPGGRWQTWVSVDGRQRQGPYAPDADAARTVADGLARGALLELATVTPSRANEIVRDLATGDGRWDRTDLVAVIGHRLTDTDRADLAVTRDSQRLTELMRDAGVLAPTTMLHVLRAEDFPVDGVYPIAVTIGAPVVDAIRLLHDRWDVDRLTAGRELGAEIHELRAAGCSPVEMLAVAPREELRRLDAREHTWELAAPTLVEAGYTVAEAVRHLAAHAPTPETFAAGVTVLVDSPVEAFSLTGRHAQVEDLARLSERYGLDPAETAAVVAAACVPVDKAANVIGQRCAGDTDMTAELAARHLGLLEWETTALVRGEPVLDIGHAAPDAVREVDHPSVEHASLAVSMEPA
jgi:hypothetical protein